MKLALYRTSRGDAGVDRTIAATNLAGVDWAVMALRLIGYAFFGLMLLINVPSCAGVNRNYSN